MGLSTSAVLTSLHPFTLYEIFVQAATARGLGPPATVYITTPEGGMVLMRYAMLSYDWSISIHSIFFAVIINIIIFYFLFSSLLTS